MEKINLIKTKKFLKLSEFFKIPLKQLNAWSFDIFVTFDSDLQRGLYFLALA